MSDDRQRIDKWLWHARIVRTRAAAALLASAGHVRVNGGRIEVASRLVKAGDVVTVALERRVRVLKVTGFAPRRGSAGSTPGLYEDLTAADVSQTRDKPPAALREPGAGRPTKRERRLIERLTRDRNS